MIPKIIHYAWFGNPMPNDVKERIEEWKKSLPGWKFILWNESNFDFTNFSFTKKIAENHEWGYVADELRFDVLNKFGGFYLDTDMIIKRDLAPFLTET
jgi:mannosyltransferase OCH1-like enzyme